MSKRRDIERRLANRMNHVTSTLVEMEARVDQGRIDDAALLMRNAVAIHQDVTRLQKRLRHEHGDRA